MQLKPAGNRLRRDATGQPTLPMGAPAKAPPGHLQVNFHPHPSCLFKACVPAGRRYLVLALASFVKLRGKKYQWHSHRYKLLLWPGQLKPQWTLNTDCAPAINCCACGNWSIKIQACSTTAILVFLLLRKYHHKIFGLKFRPKMKVFFFLFLQISSLEQIFFK